jgi:hypothetical protein
MEQREDGDGHGGNGDQVRGADCGEWTCLCGRKQAVDGVWSDAIGERSAFSDQHSVGQGVIGPLSPPGGFYHEASVILNSTSNPSTLNIPHGWKQISDSVTTSKLNQTIGA